MREEENRLPDRLAYRNLEAEQSVLGAALQDEKAVKRLREMEIDAFTEPENRVLAASILEVNSKNQPVDLVTMHTVLSEHGKLDRSPKRVPSLCSRSTARVPRAIWKLR